MSCKPLTTNTYQLRLDLENCPVGYVLITNNEEGEPHQVFLRFDNPEHFEWEVALSVMMTRCLQAGVDPEVLINDLKEIHSPRTAHMIPKGGGDAPSLCYRIGLALEEHLKQEN